MGILEDLAKSPGIVGLAALGIGLFVFRDRISQFFSDITGGAAGAASIAETGGILARNLTSNLTLTPLPEDPIFGEQGFFAGIANFFKDFKIPSFDFTETVFVPEQFKDTMFEPRFQGTEGEGRAFTDVGMAAARARQTEEEIMPMGFPSEGNVIRDLLGTPFAVSNVAETQVAFQERAGAFVQALPEVTAFTSLPGSATDFIRRQLSRESEDFEDVLAAEARRSETIFAGLFGNVQNPNF